MTLTKNPKPRPDENHLGFGKYYTDHMFIMDYDEGKGWHDARIVPYAPIVLDPAAMCIHYAQEAFEGLKAYRHADGSISLFRPLENCRRLNQSDERLCIPHMEEEDILQAIRELVRIDATGCRVSRNVALHPSFCVCNRTACRRASERYVSIRDYPLTGRRLLRRGAGACQDLCGGQVYPRLQRRHGGDQGCRELCAVFESTDGCAGKGYSQVLWLDSVEQKYVEEVGAMNIFFKIDGEVITPALTGSVLPGITRKSTVELLKYWGVPVSERRLSVDEIRDAALNGKLEEVFGTGTAAVISPVGVLCYKDEKFVINNFEIGELTQKIYDELTGIQWGTRPDPFGWVMPL